MSELINHDAWGGVTTRVYVWYPDEPTTSALPDWEHDPVIAQYVDEMRAGGRYALSVARYYHNPKPAGQVVVIARLVAP